MSCAVYLQKYDYSDVPRGSRKKTESQNGLKLLKIAINDIYGISLPEIEREAHGKPYFPTRSDIFFNISHSGDYAAAAVCTYPVGVDIQVMRPAKDALIRKLCRGAELDYVMTSQDRSRAFIHLWALKESYIKAIGLGMSFPMNEINFDIRGFSGSLTGRISNKEGLYLLRDNGDHALAVCALI